MKKTNEKQLITYSDMIDMCLEKICPICDVPLVDGKCQDIGDNNCDFTQDELEDGR